VTVHKGGLGTVVVIQRHHTIERRISCPEDRCRGDRSQARSRPRRSASHIMRSSGLAGASDSIRRPRSNLGRYVLFAPHLTGPGRAGPRPKKGRTARSSIQGRDRRKAAVLVREIRPRLAGTPAATRDRRLVLSEAGQAWTVPNESGRPRAGDGGALSFSARARHLRCQGPGAFLLGRDRGRSSRDYRRAEQLKGSQRRLLQTTLCPEGALPTD